MAMDRRMINQVVTEVTKDLVDRGKLIEAGFAAFRHLIIAKDASPLQIEEMRLAWMAGADHLFSSIMVMLDPGAEPTDKDLTRMDLVERELAEWRGRISERAAASRGRA